MDLQWLNWYERLRASLLLDLELRCRLQEKMQEEERLKKTGNW